MLRKTSSSNKFEKQDCEHYGAEIVQMEGTSFSTWLELQYSQGKQAIQQENPL